MWRNYLTVGVRALAKNRVYAAINIFGLAIGLAACALILLYVRYEANYDRWLPGAADTYQLQSWNLIAETGERHDYQQSQYVAGTLLKKDFPEVEQVVFALPSSETAIRNGQSVQIEDAIWVDAPFLDVVRLPLIAGDRRTALDAPGTAVLSQSQARALFGDRPVVGRTLTLLDDDGHADYRITGVMRDLPRDSTLRADMILRFDAKADFATQPEFLTGWGDISGINFVRLRAGADPAAIARGMPAWEARNVHATDGGDNPGKDQDWKLVNIRDVHLGQGGGGMTPTTDPRALATFALVALLILVMGCVNFINLSTARAGQRAREVALRKVLGAARRQLVLQFLGESLLIAAIATVLGLAAAELMLPAVNGLLDSGMRLTYAGADGVLLPALGMAIAIGLLAGLYPALVLSRFQPAQVLRANQSGAEPNGSGRLRNALVVAQFAVSIALIVCTTVVYLQTAYARTADPGFRREELLQISLPGRLAGRGEALANEAMRVEGVRSAATTSLGIATPSHMGRAVWLPGAAKPINIGNYAVSSRYFETLGLKTLAGRSLDPSRGVDTVSVPDSIDGAAEQALAARGGNAVLNLAAVDALGFRTPADAIGKQVRVDLFMGDGKPRVPITIVGVVGDARVRSVREPIDKVMYRLGTDYASSLVLRYQGDPRAVREGMEALWRRLAPEAPFQARFSEDIVDELYRAEDARARLFATFAVLAVIIGCLGLFGLAAFTAERRTKEIGIRKVMGARTRDIVRLLVWQFSRPVLIANIIAWPIAWWLMREWLNGFDARVALTPVPFLGAGLLAAAIAVATIGSHAYRVAQTSPVRALRNE